MPPPAQGGGGSKLEAPLSFWEQGWDPNTWNKEVDSPRPCVNLLIDQCKSKQAMSDMSENEVVNSVPVKGWLH